ncbi:nitroreductase/quinone reductase family protein [Nocardia terpenica]|uniref:Nitroreductase n=1 Tax=Nocardia terpenica TaxID=455432 RepID=A0A291RUQ9_9NOCA|nr:nitroreductase/quinone reductase family protein [Nocardia terpenica]ATL71075.1 nitroreductase [Nocardia terpenica]
MTAQFPNRTWGSRTSLISRAAVKFSSTRVGSRAIQCLIPWDRKLLQRTDGRYTMLGPIGAPTVLLTTIGRKSGAPRTSPLLYAHGGDVLYIIGSNFGGPNHPAWTLNLLAHPEAEVALAGERIPVRAKLIEDPAEKERVFGLFTDIASTYTAYRSRTTRDLRIFELRRD